MPASHWAPSSSLGAVVLDLHGHHTILITHASPCSGRVTRRRHNSPGGTRSTARAHFTLTRSGSSSRSTLMGQESSYKHHQCCNNQSNFTLSKQMVALMGMLTDRLGKKPIAKDLMDSAHRRNVFNRPRRLRRIDGNDRRAARACRYRRRAALTIHNGQDHRCDDALEDISNQIQQRKNGGSSARTTTRNQPACTSFRRLWAGIAAIVLGGACEPAWPTHRCDGRVVGHCTVLQDNPSWPTRAQCSNIPSATTTRPRFDS